MPLPAHARLQRDVENSPDNLAALVGGVPLPEIAIVGDYIVDGNIGAPAMKNWVVTLDLAQQRLWIMSGT